ncbi:MAG: hypothetical protein LKF48_10585, partial [Prevotella sp.]
TSHKNRILLIFNLKYDLGHLFIPSILNEEKSNISSWILISGQLPAYHYLEVTAAFILLHRCLHKMSV